MKREFKFEVGQYVNIINAIDIDSPCKIEYRFFDGVINVYILRVGKEKSTFVPEINLELYVDNHINMTVFDMKEEILDLRKRIEVLEAGIIFQNQTSNGSSLPASKVKNGNERRYEEAGEEENMPASK